MNFLKSNVLYKKAFLFFIALNLTHFSFSQKTDSTKNIYHFGGVITATNNCISLIPTFSLGKPAVMFDMSMGKGKFSFEPQFRFALDTKPWGFIFWWRYKLLQTNKFAINIGAHPSLNFRTETDSVNGVAKEVIVTRRYVAAELSPNYLLSKNISIGMYYLYSHGIDEGTIKNTNFLTINSNFSNIKITNRFFMRFTPQFYYLKLDKQDGYYFTSAFTLAKRNFPLSVSAIINKAIHTDIPGKSFVWNASLVYTFNKAYARQ